jgi:FkbM family methyltransferase
MSDSDSETELIMSSGYPASSRLTDPSKNNRKAGYVARVSVTRLDRLVRELELKRVDWLKIDAEGMELKVLQGGIRLLENYGPKIILEGGYDCKTFLSRLGYAITPLRGTSSYIFCYLPSL